MKSNKGITLAVLAITIIVLAIIGTVTLNISVGIIKEKNLKSIVTNMLLIQARVNIIKEKNTVSATENPLIGEQADASLVSSYNQDGIWYKWSNSELEDEGINVKLKDGIYYLVNYETGEVIYSKGYKSGDVIYYTLTELKELDKNEMSVK